MLQVAEIVFWTSLSIVFYTYAGYPLLLLVLVNIKKKIWKPRVYKADIPDLVPVTLIVAAFNEEKIMRTKIANTLQLDYPQEKFNIIFVTDGSTDGSNAMIKQFPAIKLLYEPERRGKLAAMNRAVRHVEGGILIFSDANTVLNSDCIHKLVRHFNDPRVGGVAGEKRIISEDGVAGGEGTYWKYESLLKRLDSDLYSVVGAAGELFSIRSALYTPLNEDIILDDFVQSLKLCEKGYVVRYEPDAFAGERASSTLAEEKERKIRISAGGFQAIRKLKGLLNIFRYGILSFQYISHRVLRWTLCPLSLVLALISSGYLYMYASDSIYKAAVVLQVIFYLLAVAGLFLRWRILYLPFYFCFMNYCVFAGFLRFVQGRQPAAWQKAERR